MKLFGYEITKAREKALQSINTSLWWSPLLGGIIHEPFSGAWQQNAPVLDTREGLLRFAAIYTCITGIAADVAKCALQLCEVDGDVWTPIQESHGNSGDATVLQFLRKPNHYQTQIEFIEQWIASKLLAGNTYVLKERNDRDEIVAAYILDPCRVKVLLSDSGDVFYELGQDYLAGVDNGPVTVPAREIFHDRTLGLWSQLVGTAPLYACAVSGTMGGKIQSNSTQFFNNKSTPGGIITAPGRISDDSAKQLKAEFQSGYSGVNAGKVAVLGDGLKFEAQAVAADNAQLIEQLGWSVEDVARAFHYPLHKLGISNLTLSQGSVEAGNITYYSDCLQIYFEKLEACMDDGLELPAGRRTCSDIDSLLRMDTDALYTSLKTAGNWMKLNEQRKRTNLPPLKVGGETVYKQEQDHAIEAIFKRDQGPDPFGNNKPAAAPAVPSTPAKSIEEKGVETADISTLLLGDLRKESIA